MQGPTFTKSQSDVARRCARELSLEDTGTWEGGEGGGVPPPARPTGLVTVKSDSCERVCIDIRPWESSSRTHSSVAKLPALENAWPEIYETRPNYRAARGWAAAGPVISDAEIGVLASVERGFRSMDSVARNVSPAVEFRGSPCYLRLLLR